MKKGQLSTFIILGIILLLVVSLLLVLNSLSQKQVTQTTSTFSAIQFALFPPDQYVQLCTEQELLKMMNIISANGGLYDPSDPNITNFRYAQYYPYSSESFLFHYREDSGQLVITPQMVSEQIDQYLGGKVKSCIDETLYEDQGFEVNAGDISTQTTISREDIVILVSYPLELISKETSVKKDSFQVRVQYPYGYLLDTVREIINHELEENNFLPEIFMNQPSNIAFNSYIIDIQKYKPYPHTLYNLSVEKDGVKIPFYFAIEGKEVFSEREIDLETQQFLGDVGGCCQVNGACFKDTSEQLCSFAQGVFTEDEDCSCIDNSVNEKEVSSTLLSCDGKPSGYSYCESYEGVGGRDLRVICQDGQWVEEYCRDFRQEICVQEDVGAMSYTQCRLNNANSCSSCTTQDCCEQKDCQYLPGGACVPKKPLGLRFWDTQMSSSYCSDAFSQLPLVSTTTDAQVLCSQMGDCSLKPNFIGEYPYEPSQLFTERKSLLHDFEPFTYNNSIIVSTETSLSSSFSFSTILAKSLEQLDILVSSPLDEFYDPSTDTEQESLFVCQPYTPPTLDQCSMCESLGECSEYSCRSLGDNCFYIVDASGAGVCKTINVTSGDLDISNIRVSQKVVNPIFINQSPGFIVSENISAGESFDVTFETSQPALCKPTYLPNQAFSQIHTSDLSFGVYTTNHSLQLRFINDLPIFETLLDRFEVPSFSSLASAMVEFKYRLDQLQARYPYVQKFQLPLYSQVSHFVDAYLNPQTQPLVSGIIDLLSQKTYGLFFSCVSQTGATNTNTFVLLQLENSCNEEIVIESLIGDNGLFVEDEFYITTNKWAECKYDYADKPYEIMNFTMDCPDTLFGVSADGSYKCRGDVPPLAESVAIKCSQHPDIFASDYTFNLSFAYNDSALLGQSVELTNMSTNFSVRNATYITIQTPVPYLCSVNNSYLPCTLDSCQLTEQFWNESIELYCEPRDSQRYCSTSQPIVNEDATIFEFLEPEEFTLTSQVLNTTIQIISSTNVTCSVFSAGTILELARNEYMFDKEPYVGRSVRIVCEDDFGQSEQTMIDYVS